MKRSNLLSLNMTNKIVPALKFDWLPTNLPILVAAAIVLSTSVIALQIFQAKKPQDNTSLAWFVANPKEALATNKICFDNPQLKSSQACVNSLQALDLTHKGPNS